MCDESLHPCVFHVPEFYNDGKPVEKAKVRQILKALDRQFQGYRILGTELGSWMGQEERMLAIKVAVPRERLDELRAVVVEIGKDLGQKQMYFEVGPPGVELLKVPAGKTLASS